MAEEKGCIGVIPLGTPARVVVEVITARIPQHLGPPARLLPPLETPSYAFDPARLQYNVALIIRNMETMTMPGYRKILGVLAVDLFVPVFTHVFGEAREGGRCAAVSSYRLKRDGEGPEAPADVVAERGAKVALHELAHLFSVGHCMDRNCLMHFSMDLRELDEMPMEFCRYCRASLAESLRR